MRNNLYVKLYHAGETEGSLVQSMISFKTEEDFLKDIKEAALELSESFCEQLELHKIDDNNYIIVDNNDCTIMRYEIVEWEGK